MERFEAIRGSEDYLGDGVYVELYPFDEVILTTREGDGPTNTIVLNADVLAAFDRWRKRVLQE